MKMRKLFSPPGKTKEEGLNEKGEGRENNDSLQWSKGAKKTYLDLGIF